MQWFFETLTSAFAQIFLFDAGLFEIVWLTLKVSLSALVISSFLALPTAAWLSLNDTWFRRTCLVCIHALMGLPPVLIGLLVYLLLSRQGPLGELNLLFTPLAMIIAQTLLIFPIVCGVSYQVFRQKQRLLNDLFYSLGLSWRKRLKTVMYEARFQVLNAMATGLGRGLAEVGAVMIVGGNILHHTRTMTTSIALETSKGEIVTAVSLGIILVLISLLLNMALLMLNRFWGQGRYA